MAGNDPRESGAASPDPAAQIAAVEALLDALVGDQESVRRSAAFWGSLFLGLGGVATAALFVLPQVAALAPVQKLGPCVVLTAAAALYFAPWAVARQRLVGIRSLRRLLIRAEGLEEGRRRTLIHQVLQEVQVILRGQPAAHGEPRPRDARSETSTGGRDG